LTGLVTGHRCGPESRERRRRRGWRSGGLR